MFELRITTRTPVFGASKRDELHAIVLALRRVAQQLETAGAPPHGGSTFPIQDGEGNVCGSCSFDGGSLFAPSPSSSAPKRAA